ncbi:hypothetical protein [Rubinisphaera italica]|uniref:Uncharacterized protein n=1 Tax=Rubinisphaera italica TaxID=2527969 RepID=A0A5C5XEX9_9PLAN|nr:hypothetical protein [Rubinisphaera italica]TWT61354.1 hypothetical protein Pan54_20900 [Rubinisphaera italica]
MLLHALLGCCAHHAHACHHVHKSTQIVNERDAVHQHCHHKGEKCGSHTEAASRGSNSESPAHSHEDSIPCNEHECTYVSVVRTNELVSTIALTLTAILNLKPVNAVIVWPSLAIAPHNSLIQSDAPRLRAHLQVWSL